MQRFTVTMKPLPRVTRLSGARSLVRAARFFDGVTRQWLFDNPKTVVLARRGDAVRYHPGLLEIAGALRVQPRLCRPRRPTDKGGVERANRYLHDRFFAARTITSIDDGNRQLLDFIRDIADVRPHARFRDRTVAEVFAEEKERLLSLPASLPETDLVAPASVDTTAFVRFGTNLYSVPPRYAPETVTLVASDREVRILDGADVAISRRHERASTIISTNLAFKEWGTVFPGAACVVALVDRFTQHCHTLDIDSTATPGDSGPSRPPTVAPPRFAERSRAPA